MKTLSDMLTYRRAHNSLGEAQFIDRFILPSAPEVIAAKDGTIHAYVRRIGDSPAVFCAHVDSVHNRMNPEPRQKIAFDSFAGEFIVADAAQRDCLGADDAAGCYVLLEMIAASVPGMYIFFRGEERGGIGSNYVAHHRANLFDGKEYAIQFDRRGTQSIITEMMVGRTCSDEFALSLSDALGMGHTCDNTGSFTDTANLSDLIPECTNISIGYENEHSRHETLNANYVLQLTAAFIAAFKNGSPELTIARVPGQFEASPELVDMTDEELIDMAYSCDPDTIAKVLMGVRDELIAAYQYAWSPSQ